MTVDRRSQPQYALFALSPLFNTTEQVKCPYPGKIRFKGSYFQGNGGDKTVGRGGKGREVRKGERVGRGRGRWKGGGCVMAVGGGGRS